MADVVAPNLRVLFVGINPGLYSAAVGHHFAGPSNRFWPALHAAGLTPRRFSPAEERELLRYGYGITNFVARPTATASELGAQELKSGARRLCFKVRRLRPRIVAVLGIDAYQRAFAVPRPTLGAQTLRLGAARVWVLPNPSGANAHYRPAELARLFRALRRGAEAKDLRSAGRTTAG